MEKPHIFYKEGYWRVSPMPKPYHKNNPIWRKAYDFIHKLNR